MYHVWDCMCVFVRVLRIVAIINVFCMCVWDVGDGYLIASETRRENIAYQ